MKGLLMKDLYLVSNFKKQYGLLLLFIGGWSIFTQSFSFLAMYTILLGGMMTFSIMSMDEAVHFNRYALTMPVSVRTLVKEKYALTCLCIAGGSLLALVIEMSAMLTQWNEGAMEWIMLAVLSTFFLTAYTVSLPVVLKYGVEKARYIYMGVMLAMGAAVFGVAYLAKNTPVMMLEGTPSVATIMIIFGIMLLIDVVMVGASYRISLWVVRGKEW